MAEWGLPNGRKHEQQVKQIYQGKCNHTVSPPESTQMMMQAKDSATRSCKLDCCTQRQMSYHALCGTKHELQSKQCECKKYGKAKDHVHTMSTFKFLTLFKYRECLQLCEPTASSHSNQSTLQPGEAQHCRQTSTCMDMIQKPTGMCPLYGNTID